MCGDCRFADAVTPGYKIRSASEAVSGGHKNYSAGKTVSTGHKTGSVNFVPGRDKTAAVDSVSGGYKNAGADGKQTAVSTGDKNAAADSVSGGYKTAATDDDNASPASATCMDAFTGTAWITFSATGHVGMVFSGAGRGAFTVAGCFLLLPFGMRCAGCADVVMNSFFACRDDFIFSQFVISFLPLKEPLRVRGDFSLLEVL